MIATRQRGMVQAPEDKQGPLRICLLGYRGNPHCGGQGVYLKHLSKALTELGHAVEVISGPPLPELDNRTPLVRLPSLDLYNPENLFRMPSARELCDPVNLIEWASVSTMGFPEPFTFGIRANRHLRNSRRGYDIVHDNQSLSYGVWAISKRAPTIATIHHPITRDRAIAIRAAATVWKKIKALRWYSFIGMQRRVARTLPRIITVSKQARDDIRRDFGIPSDRFRVIPNGIDTGLFYPIPEIAREKNRLIVTNSADTPLKGLDHLLVATAELAKHRAVRLIVVGSPAKNGRIEGLLRGLGIGDRVEFTGRIDNREFVRQYARASVAIVPSLYEGFGLPAGEAMACGVPVVGTTAGALPEVIGDAGVLVPPAKPGALAAAVAELLDHPDRAEEIGQAGFRRVRKRFTWESAARKTVDAYREVILDHR